MTDPKNVAQELIRRHHAPDIEPGTDWNNISVPQSNASFYERYWQHQINSRDRYPALRGHDTPSTRAMRFAEDAARTTKKVSQELQHIAWMLTNPDAHADLHALFAQITAQRQTQPQQPDDETENRTLVHRFQQVRGKEVTDELLERLNSRRDIGMHLVYLGLRYRNQDAVADGIDLMHEAQEKAFRELARPCEFRRMTTLELFNELAITAAAQAPERFAQEIRNAAAAAAVSGEFDALVKQRPPYDPDKAPHHLETALQNLHENAFFFRNDGLYNRLRRTLANSDAAVSHKAIEEVRQYSKDLNRLHEIHEDAAEDDKIWIQYRNVRGNDKRKELQEWLNQQIDELSRMKKPQTLTWTMLWRRALSNFHKQPDNPQSGLVLTWGIRENGYLLPLLRKETTMLMSLRNKENKP